MYDIRRHKLLGAASVTAGRSSARMVGNSQQYSSTSSIVGGDYDTDLLEGILPKVSSEVINSIYREIYLMDSISGPTVDLMATLPWSDYSLQGVDDQKALNIYEASCRELGIESHMIQFSTSYLVLGVLIGSLLFDSTRGIFTDILVHNPDFCEITPIPMTGYDPKIDLKISPQLKKFLTSKDPRDQDAIKEIPQDMYRKLLSGSKIELEPLNTLYLNRTYVPGVERMSYYTRILPIWLIEKALMRGTIIGAWRRQRSILHIVAGNEEWDPTDEQLSAISNLFTQADQDPQGAVVVTRPGIETSELRNGEDFWKASDEYDTFANIKMRALGINESFLSGDATYNSMDTALSVFLENLRTFRDHMTNAIMYNKIFLTMAKYHDIRKRTTAELQHNVRLSSTSRHRKSVLDGSAKKAELVARNNGVSIYAAKNLAEAANFVVPTVYWHKELRASSDTQLMEMYSTAQEKGIPIPLAMFATAAGLQLEEVLDDLEKDITVRKRIQEYKSKLESEGVAPPGGDGDGGMFASTVKPNSTTSRLMKNVALLAEHIPDSVEMTPEKCNQLLALARRLGLGKKIPGNPGRLAIS